MTGYHVPWWAALIGALTPTGWALMFGLGYWVGRRRDEPRDNGDRHLYRQRRR